MGDIANEIQTLFLKELSLMGWFSSLRVNWNHLDTKNLGFHVPNLDL